MYSTSHRYLKRFSVPLAAALGIVGASIGAPQAVAARAPTTCPSSTGEHTVTFEAISAEQTCVIPPHVTSVLITAVGAPGGAGLSEEADGAGALVNGTIAVTPGQTLYIEVGGPGYGGAGGFNGGGSGNVDAAGGGGASDVRSAPAVNGLSPDPRLLIAAGGGGAGEAGFSPGTPGGSGGNAGAAGAAGAPNNLVGGALGGGGGGGAASSLEGGSGGTGGTTTHSQGFNGKAGGKGSLGQGGAGGTPGLGLGGGGGGGLYGGGGGGSGSDAEVGEAIETSGGGGGGGGSSLAPTGGSVAPNNTALPPEVVVSYTVPSAPTARIISPSSGHSYSLGAAVGTSFSCSEATGGPGIGSCSDGAGHTALSGTITGALDTTTVGAHTYTVTASSKDGLSSTASISYTVVQAPPSAGQQSSLGTQGPASTSEPPSNAFRISSVRSNRRRNGVTLTLVLPGAGSLDILATHSLPRARVSSLAGAGRLVWARLRRSISGGATVTLELRPTRAGKALARRHRRFGAALHVGVCVSFTPTGGHTLTECRHVRVLRRRASRSGRG